MNYIISKILYNKDIIIFICVIISLIISFREKLQQIESIEKMFDSTILRVLYLIFISYITSKNYLLGISLGILYLSIYIYIINIPPESEEIYTTNFVITNDKDKKNVISNEPEAKNKNNIVEGLQK